MRRSDSGSGYEQHFIFPVSFSDGVTEIGNKDIVIFPSTQFHFFRAALSQCIGIHHKQFSVFLKSQKWGRKDIVMPVNSKTDFSKICGKRDVFFLVLLKQQSIARRAGIQNHQHLLDHGKQPAAAAASFAKEDAGRGGVLEGFKGFERRVRDLQIEKEKFLMSLGIVDSELLIGKRQRKVLICEECEKARGTGLQVGFHHCVNDVIIYGFRSTAGAVCRPAENHHAVPYSKSVQ